MKKSAKSRKNKAPSTAPAYDGIAPPPTHLQQDGQRLWRLLLTQFHIPPDMLVLLEMCCESFDRMHLARLEIEKTGMTVLDRFGQAKMAPAVLIERDSRALCARLLKQLGIGQVPTLTELSK